MKIKTRKKQHVDAAMKKQVEYFTSSGFSEIRFVHNSLPEIDYNDIDLTCKFFSKKLAAPIVISGMTGGYPRAKAINLALAAAAEKEGVAFGLGSQRAMLEHPETASTYKVRKVAPSIPIIGNIGACQLSFFEPAKVQEVLDKVEADALAIHLNPLQEMVQPEGDRKFSGILAKIEQFCNEISLPVIVKETGAGISGQTADALKKAGVKMVDVSGTGGTSWSKVEYLRSKQRPTFAEWGNPTAICVAQCAGILPTIASGGLRSGLDAAKAIALGASFAAAALPFIKSKNPQLEIATWKQELATTMLLCGAKDLSALSKAKIVIFGNTAEQMERLGLSPSAYAIR
ncbi:MAG: type 2 isopentenyl-diphosphate Delta-isomerase [Candidatus Anstonellaceae archaeon]